MHVITFAITPTALIGSLILGVILIVGLVGARRRHTGMLKFYWIIQFIGIILVIVALVAVLIIFLVAYRDLKTHNEDKPEVYTFTASAPTSFTSSSAHKEHKNKKEQVIENALNYLSQHKDWVMVGAVVALVWSIIGLCLKVRSIVLAQRLCKQVESLPYCEDVEAAAIQTDSEPEKSEADAQPMYVIPQPMFAAPQQQANFENYPGVQLVPIYVDRFGNPIAQ